MQQELVELQPKLIETSRETEELIGIIETETVQVEAKKTLVEADEAVANKAAMEAKEIKVRTPCPTHISSVFIAYLVK